MTQTSHVHGFHNGDAIAEISTHYLIVGTGPAGASLACFLAQHGNTITLHNNPLLN
jgi:NADPH-dependent glutamate synthase beta subunit-like oxidoreductase